MVPVGADVADFDGGERPPRVLAGLEPGVLSAASEVSTRTIGKEGRRLLIPRTRSASPSLKRAFLNSVSQSYPWRGKSPASCSVKSQSEISI